ncbi:MAG: AAA family ATPase [SAR202 cluster bacterium]|nr:AAA family ATPase [SAR202 cluster bacterium]
MPTDLLHGLNKQQREAVETVNGPVLIVAGPGSGKTRVITNRIAYLVKVCGVAPYRIGAVTFTNKAARELRERLEPMLGHQAQELTATTFHSFCALVLRKDGHHLGLDKSFAIYDSADQLSLIKRAMKEVDVDAKQFTPGAIQSAISSAKNQLIGVEGFGLNKQNYFDEIVHRVYERYDALLAQSMALDFDDLLFKSHTLFDKFPEVAAKYQERYVHFMIDEFQDTNVTQYAIARLITQKYRNLCVVGDPDQSIYSWRHADIRNILSFKSDFPEAKVIALEENYRSTQTILEAAQRLIEPNKQRVEKALYTKNDRGVPIIVKESYNEQEEAQYVVKEIERLSRQGYRKSDIAVMYRVNAQSRALEEACMRYGMPYLLVGTVRFYQRQEVKDLTAYLRLLENPSDDVSFLRVCNVPTRGIGQRTLDDLQRLARDQNMSMYAAIEMLAGDKDQPLSTVAPLPARSLTALRGFRDLIAGIAEECRTLSLVDTIDLVLKKSGYKDYIQNEADGGDERWENLLEFRNTANEFRDIAPDEALTAFLEQVSLVNDTDNVGAKSDTITLITLHQAKGLEYPVVFIVGMEEGTLPHIRSLTDPEEMEEERRLAYVGVTRAKKLLYLTRVFRRGFQGVSEPKIPSRFLADIPKELTSGSQSDLKQQSFASRAPGWSTPGGQSSRPSISAPSVRIEHSGPEPTRTKISSNSPQQPQQPQRPGQSEAPKTAALKTGDRVRHKKFGEGIVTGTKPTGADLEVTVAFKDGAGVKRLLLSFAPLEKAE